MSFPERLFEMRTSRGLTQKQVYEGVGMSPLGYEYGTCEPAYQKLFSRADLVNVSLDYLVGKSNNPQRI